MSRLLREKVAGELLTRLEDLELPTLSWGVTTGMLSKEEVIGCIDQYGIEYPDALQGIDPDEVLDDLLASVLLFRVPGTTPRRYRTRMAETLRLATRLRQLFGPRHLEDPPHGWWERGKLLVADYRLHVTPRQYPSRDIPMADALRDLEQLPGWSSVQTSVATAYINGRDLARFQRDAAAEVYRSLVASRNAGVIIGAGTGSGKTLAFYLPDFAAIAASPVRNRVHTLALYPRKELLRDQLREAIDAVRSISGALRSARKQQIRVGTLYGDTPRSSSDYDVFGRDGHEQGGKWARRGQDAVCPYLRCPDCGTELLWKYADRKAVANTGRDRLTCASCQLVLDDVVVLTRESLLRRPPDILFTTTETLNRQASDPLGWVLGWRAGAGPSGAAPRLVLLDEVHTYSGTHGAQVGLLLRRWRASARSAVTFVGLSATLKDARSFFAELTGLSESAVESVEPRKEHLVSEGRQYALALRGDPVSGASLLSTSIQAAMLFGRTMDPPGDPYLHGTTGFLFTDDLDVTNRFYGDLRNAEGERQGRRESRVLAGLRSPNAPFSSARYKDGQSWDLVQQIGRDLDPDAQAGGLVVGRTSSQDSGVDQGADLIVATASLEVGFNDSRVGLVLQHKAPFDPASFIQRRGRAGRRRDTRPWTVVTLSDYGRDRLAYQAYDTLFSPELAARSLPVRNRSLLKAQGAEALLDWLAVKNSPRGGTSDPRDVLRSLGGTSPRTVEAGHLADLLQETFESQDLQDDLAQHVGHALDIGADAVRAVLWEEPRSLLLSVAPTIRRRLQSLSVPGTPVRADPGVWPGILLPEFITRTLFEPLNVPEVSFSLPFRTPRDEALPIERALREAVPGRVSRRFGYQKATDRTWLPLPADGAGDAIDIEAISSRYTKEGTWALPGQEPVQVIRPHVIDLKQPDREITDQAQGFPRWASQIIESPARLSPEDIPDPSPWAARVTSAGFATHAMGNPAQARRMTTGATCETSYTNGKSAYSTVRYTLNGTPAALGFRLSVDGARFTLAPLDLNSPQVARYLTSPGWRTMAFTTAIAEDQRLDGIANTFQRTWLTLVYLVAFAIEGMDGSRDPAQVHQALKDGQWGAQVPTVLKVLYRDDSEQETPSTERLVGTLTGLSNMTEVRSCLDEHGHLLWAADVAQRSAPLARRAYHDTIAAAILAAALRACPDAREQDLIVDVLPPASGNNGSDGEAEVWLTETALGGLGIIEHLAGYYRQDPRRFWGLVDTALGPNDFEYVDATVTRLLHHVRDEPAGDAAQAISRIREAASAHEAGAALTALRRAWTELDGYPKRSAVSALSVRLLRPGSTRGTDELALGVIEAWDVLQDRLRFEIDARVIAFGVGAKRISVAGASGNTTSDQVFSMLWPRGYQARSQHLDHYQPYARKLLDRLLVEAACEEHLRRIDVTAPGWRDEYVAELQERGAVVLTAPASQSGALSRALREVPARSVDRDVMRVYGTVRDVTRAGAQWQATIEIKEAAQ